MKTQENATLDDLYAVEGKAELVDGELILISPTGRGPSRAAARIFISLDSYARVSQFGEAYTDNTGFVVDLPNHKSFSTDVSFHAESLTSLDMKFVQGAPIFAVEVRSEGDYGAVVGKRIAQKRADYFAAGTQVVWDADLLSDDVVHSYHSQEPATSTIYRRNEVADAEPTLPGWRFPTNDLFP